MIEPLFTPRVAFVVSMQRLRSTTLLAGLLDRCPDLTTLRMAHCDLNLKHLVVPLTRCLALRFENLCLGGNTLHDVDSDTMLALARATKRLSLADTHVRSKQSRVAHSADCTAATYQSHVPVCATTTATVVLRGCEAANALVSNALRTPVIGAAMAPLYALQTLDVSYANLTGTNAAVFLSTLSRHALAYLATLHVGGNMLGATGCAALGAMVVATPTLKAVHAGECALTVDDVAPLFQRLASSPDGLGVAPSLKTLHLDRNRFNASSATRLASLLTPIRCLEHLDLSGSDFGHMQQTVINSWTDAVRGRTYQMQAPHGLVLGMGMRAQRSDGLAPAGACELDAPEQRMHTNQSRIPTTTTQGTVRKTHATTPGVPPPHAHVNAASTASHRVHEEHSSGHNPKEKNVYTAEELVQGLEDVWSDDE